MATNETALANPDEMKALRQQFLADQQKAGPALASVSPVNEVADMHALRQQFLDDQAKGKETTLQGRVTEWAKPVTDWMGQHYSNGEVSTHNGLLYADVADGKITMEQARAAAQQEKPDFTPWYDKLAPLVEATPTLVEMGKGGLVGGAAGATTGALVGGSLGAGAGAGVGAIPMAAAGSFAGAMFGGEAGSVYTGARIAQGQILKSIDDEDVNHQIPHKQAVELARAGGAVIGALQRFGVGQIGKQLLQASVKELAVHAVEETGQQAFMKVSPQVAGNAAKQSLASIGESVKQTLMGNFLKQYYKNAGITFGDVALQGLVSIATKTIAQMQNNVPVKDLPQQLAGDFVNAFNFALASPAVTAGINTAGAVAGKVAAIHHVPDVADAQRAAITTQHLLLGKEIPDAATYESLLPKTKVEKATEKAATFEQKKEQRLAHAQTVLERALQAAKLISRSGKSVSTDTTTGAQHETSSAGIHQRLRRFGSSISSDISKLNTAFQFLPKAERDALIKELHTSKEVTESNNQADRQGELLKGEIEKAVGKPFVAIIKTLVHDAWAHGMREKSSSVSTALGALHNYPGGFLEAIENKAAEVLFGKFPEYLSSRKDAQGKHIPEVFRGTRAEATWLLEAMKTARNEYVADELPAMHGLTEDPKALKKALRLQGFTFKEDIPGGQTTESVLEERLDQGNIDSRKIVEGIKAFYKKHNLPILKAAHERLTGTVLKEEPGYFGQLYRDAPQADAGTPYDRFRAALGVPMRTFGAGANELPAPKSTENRTENLYGVKLRNPYTAALEAIFNTATYDALGDKAILLDHVVNNPELRIAFDRVLGKQFKHDLDTHLNDIFNMRVNRQGVYLEVLNKWMSEWGHSLLLMQPLRYVKHWLQLHTYLIADVGGGKQLPTGAFISGVLDYWNNAATANDFLWKNSKALQNKYSPNFKQAVIGGVRNSDQLAVAKNDVREFMNVFLKKGAEHADQAGMWAVVKYAKEQGLSNKQAVELAEKALKETQFTNDIGQLGNLNRESYLRIVSQFKQFPTAMFVQQVDAIREAVNHPSPATAINAFRTLAVTHTAQALFVGVDTAWVLSMHSNDQEKMGKALWRNLWEFIQGPVGAVDKITSAQNVANIAQGKFKELDFPLLPFEAVSESMKFFSTGMKMAISGETTPTEVADLIKEWSTGINAFTTKIPPEPIKHVADAIKGE